MGSVIQDLKHAGRLLISNPGFTVAAALTLAFGIGANAAIFSVVNAVLVKPLPYKEPDRLVTIFGASQSFRQAPLSPADFVQWREQNSVFEDIAVYTGGSFNLAG